jgi:NAD(P)-dependent dehydrogenase (short-subunit alcohol dehydrogenase family)
MSNATTASRPARTGTPWANRRRDRWQLRNWIRDGQISTRRGSRRRPHRPQPGAPPARGARARRIGMALTSAFTAALPALTKVLALELAPLRVNLIAPGFVDTPLSATLLGDRLDERRDQLRTTLPIGRVVGPADVAVLAIHLMTNTALTGGTYDIDGGQQLVEA